MVDTARKFEVLHLLGSGGFGTVYRARFLGEGGFSKEVALKFLNASLELDPEFTARLRDEARVLGLLRHRAILHVDALTQIDGHWTIVMEYVEGHDLAAIVRQGPAPASVTMEIVAEVASALHAAYTREGPQGQQLRLIHRDLKPSNIRLTPHGEVKVLDFGIATAEFEAREASAPDRLGTIDYMAPERFGDAGYGPASDIYALGAVAFELLTGHALGRTGAREPTHLRTHSLAREALQRAGTEADVAGLVLECLQFAPELRPSADSLENQASALSRRLSGESLRAWSGRVLSRIDEIQPARGARTGAIIEFTVRPDEPVGATTANTPIESAGLTFHLTGRAPPLTGQARPVNEPAPATAPPPPIASRPKWLAGAGLLTLSVAALLWLASPPEPAPRPAPPSPIPTIAAPNSSAATPAAPIAPISPPAPALTQPSESTSSARITKPPDPKKSGKSPSIASADPEPEPPPQPEDVGPPPAPIGALITTRGDANAVYLEGAEGPLSLPMRVPPGSYRVLVSFEGLPPKQSGGEVTVADEASIVLYCTARFGKCMPEAR